MVSQPTKASLPSTKELPCSDDTPVDNENQNFLPNLLLFLLTRIWSERMDWFFGVDMAVYHRTGDNLRIPVVPDAFLSLGVERKKGEEFRRSYATWEEGDTVPILVLEMVSHQLNDEYEGKRDLYAKLGVPYYVVYNPEYWQRDGHQPFEVYKLMGGAYRLQGGEPYWMPEVGLGIGRSRRVIGGIEREVLLWFDRQGNAYPMSEEVIESMRAQLLVERRNTLAEKQRADVERQKVLLERQRADAERQRADAERQRADAERQNTLAEKQRADREEQKVMRMAEYLRSLGLDPDELSQSGD